MLRSSSRRCTTTRSVAIRTPMEMRHRRFPAIGNRFILWSELRSCRMSKSATPVRQPVLITATLWCASKSTPAHRWTMFVSRIATLSGSILNRESDSAKRVITDSDQYAIRQAFASVRSTTASPRDDNFGGNHVQLAGGILNRPHLGLWRIAGSLTSDLKIELGDRRDARHLDHCSRAA